MKPHKLVMTAFGPFAKETTVDFDAMGSSIYLICGDTGSGKTTIFDGIMYALYGTASGGARSALGTEAFHSDFAKSGGHREEMRVALTFSNAGRTFTASRRMYWGKKGNSQRPVKESVLSESGTILTHGKGREDVDDVTLKVKEILGLDADQFRRIIMLAQGEFQRFLTAKSEERGTILGKLYDNRRHQDLQLRLKAADALLKKQEEDLARDAQMQLENFVIPTQAERKGGTFSEQPGMDAVFAEQSFEGSEWLSGEGSEQEPGRLSANQSVLDLYDRIGALSADRPDLLDVMEEVLASMRIECEELRKAIREQEQQAKSLAARRAKAEMENTLLNQLSRNRARLLALEEERGRMELIRNLVTRAEAAQRVVPAQQAMLQACSDWKRVSERIDSLEQEKNALASLAVRLDGEQRRVNEKNAPLSAGLLENRAALLGMLHFYEDLSAAEDTLRIRQKECQCAEETLAGAREKLAAALEKQQDLAKELDALAGAGAAVVSMAKREADDLEARRKALEEVQAGICEVHELAREETRLTSAYARAREKELQAETVHLHLNAALIRGQAGILADELREKLKTEGVAVCPVCGTFHTAADTASFAEHTQEIPSQKEVDKAYQAWNKARQESGKAQEAYQAGQNAHVRKTEEVLRQGSKLIGVMPWVDAGCGNEPQEESIPGDRSRLQEENASICVSWQQGEACRNVESLALFIPAAIRDCETQLSAASKKYEQARTDLVKRDRILAEQEKNNAEVIFGNKACEAAVSRLNAARMSAAQAQTSVSNWKAQLEGFPEQKEDALLKIRELTKQIEALKKEGEDAEAAFAECKNRQSENLGSLASAVAERADRLMAKQKAQVQFEESLRDEGFADEAAYRAAFSPERNILLWEGSKQNPLTAVDGDEGNLLTGVDGAEGNLLTGVKDLKGSTLADLDRQDGGVMTAGELGVWIRRRKAELDGYDRERRDVLSSIRQMEASTAGMELTDIGLLDGQIREMESRLEKLRAQERGLDSMIRTDQKIQERIVVIQRKRERLHVAYSRLNPLADAANGSFAFSRYVLNGFFERIVEHANVHLDTMTDGEYLLVPTKEGDRRSSLGLGLRILNTITNLERETASLSGGQMFEASLALALGLSDVVQMESASTIRIDSMFIDEGFGSLDGAHLDKALEVLQHLAGGKRQIGIISHVARLDECLPRKLHVIVGEHGSTVQTEVDV